MTTDRDRRSLHVGQTIEHTLARAMGLTTANAIRELDDCTNQLTSAAIPPDEQLEIARRIAEAKVSLLWNRPECGNDFLAEWARLEELGFSSLEREASMLFYRLRARCIDARSDPSRKALIVRLQQVVEAIELESVEMAGHFRASLDNLRGIGPMD